MATKIPTFVLQGKTIHPRPPKARVWRTLIEFEEHKKDGNLEDFIDDHAAIIAQTFGRDDITPEVILDNLALEDVMPLYHDCYLWVMTMISSKLKQLPNEDTAAG